MNDLQMRIIDAIKKLDAQKLEKVSKYIIYIEKNDEIPNNDTIESFIEGEELINDSNTKYYNNVEELKKALNIQKKVSLPIIWDKNENFKCSNISVELEGVDYRKKDDMEKIADFYAKYSKELAEAIVYPYISEI